MYSLGTSDLPARTHARTKHTLTHTHTHIHTYTHTHTNTHTHTHTHIHTHTQRYTLARSREALRNSRAPPRACAAADARTPASANRKAAAGGCTWG